MEGEEGGGEKLEDERELGPGGGKRGGRNLSDLHIFNFQLVRKEGARLVSTLLFKASSVSEV